VVPTTPNVAPSARWSERDLATLSALAETFVRGSALRRASLGATAIDTLDPEQIGRAHV